MGPITRAPRNGATKAGLRKATGGRRTGGISQTPQGTYYRARTGEVLSHAQVQASLETGDPS